MAEFPGTTPQGGDNQGGIQPCYYVDGVGNQFWGVQTKLGALYQYRSTTMQTTIRQLPSGITRYDGTAPIAAVDAAGNVFHAIQGPEDSSMCIMAPADGSPTRRVGPIITKGGRPGLLCDPFVGLWLIGNKEAGGRVLPPLYPIAEFVTRSAAAPGGVAPEKAEPLPNGGAAYLDNFDVFGNRTTELTPLSTWADFLRAGWFVLRMNKLVAALAQLQRQARKAGWLE